MMIKMYKVRLAVGHMGDDPLKWHSAEEELEKRLNDFEKGGWTFKESKIINSDDVFQRKYVFVIHRE